MIRGQRGFSTIEPLIAISILMIAVSASSTLNVFALNRTASLRETRIAHSVQDRVRQDLSSLVPGHPQIAIGDSFQRYFDVTGEELPTGTAANDIRIAYRVGWAVTQITAATDVMGNPIQMLKIDMSLQWTDLRGQQNAALSFTRQ